MMMKLYLLWLKKLQKRVDTLSEVTLWLGGRMLEGELVDASAAATPY